MSQTSSKYARFGIAIVVILATISYLAFTGVQESKSYYVTIRELRDMGEKAHNRHLRVAGNVQPGSIKRSGTHVEFVLIEQAESLPVVYRGSEPPPDTFKDDSQAMAEGDFGRDGVFHAKKIQAKCASKYAPRPGTTPAAPGALPGSAPSGVVNQTALHQDHPSNPAN